MNGWGAAASAAQHPTSAESLPILPIGERAWLHRSDITIQVRMDTESFIADLNRCVAAAHNAADEIRNAFIGPQPKDRGGTAP